MTEMLDTCNNLTKSPAAPGNEVMEMAEKALTEENLKQMKDTSDKLIDSLTSPETPSEPKELPKTNLVKKEIKKKIKKEVKKESEAPEKTEENTQVTAAGAW